MEAVRRQTPDDGFYTTEMVIHEDFFLRRPFNDIPENIPENAVTVYTGMSARKARRLIRDSYPSETRPEIRHLVVTGEPVRCETEDDLGWTVPVRRFRTALVAWLYSTWLKINDIFNKQQ